MLKRTLTLLILLITPVAMSGCITGAVALDKVGDVTDKVLETHCKVPQVVRIGLRDAAYKRTGKLVFVYGCDGEVMPADALQLHEEQMTIVRQINSGLLFTKAVDAVGGEALPAGDVDITTCAPLKGGFYACR